MTNLKELALAAQRSCALTEKPIPWFDYETDGDFGVEDADDRRYIAAASPDVVLELIRRLEVFTSAMKEADVYAGKVVVERDELNAKLAAYESRTPQAWLWQFSDGDWHDQPFDTLDNCESECAGYEGRAHPLFTAPEVK